MASLTLVAIVGLIAARLIYSFAKDGWNSSDVDEKLEDIDVLNENYERVKDIDTDELQEKQDKLDEVLKK